MRLPIQSKGSIHGKSMKSLPQSIKPSLIAVFADDQPETAGRASCAQKLHACLRRGGKWCWSSYISCLEDRYLTGIAGEGVIDIA
jgi:hypothetical protein